jgi:hypothetical protein
MSWPPGLIEMDRKAMTSSLFRRSRVNLIVCCALILSVVARV